MTSFFSQFTEEEVIFISKAFSQIGISYDEALKTTIDFCNKCFGKKDKEDSK